MRKIFKWFIDIYSPKEPEYYKDKKGNNVKKIGYYSSIESDNVINKKANLSDVDSIIYDIDNYKLPFEITIDDNGDIIEYYNVQGNPYSWKMHKKILKENNQYIVIEEFQNYRGFQYNRVMKGLWMVQLNYVDDNGDIHENYIDRRKNNKNIVITKETDNFYQNHNKEISISNPIEFIDYVDCKKVIFDKRRIYVRDNNYEYNLNYITSLNPYNDGLKGYGLLCRDNDNIYDCHLYDSNL